jgi:hypothetical protein
MRFEDLNWEVSCEALPKHSGAGRRHFVSDRQMV